MLSFSSERVDHYKHENMEKMFDDILLRLCYYNEQRIILTKVEDECLVTSQLGDFYQKIRLSSIHHDRFVRFMESWNYVVTKKDDNIIEFTCKDDPDQPFSPGYKLFIVTMTFILIIIAIVVIIKVVDL